MATPQLSLTRLYDDRQANVRASEGSGTTVLTIADSKWQIFNLTAARTVVLPSTSVKAGDVYRIGTQHAGASATTTLTVQSSSNALLGYVDGKTGNARFVALQDAPTLATHWTCIDQISCTSAQKVLGVSGFLGSGVGFVQNYSVATAYMTLTGDWRLRYALNFSGNGAGTGTNGGYVYLDGVGVTSATNVVPHQTYRQTHTGYAGLALTGLSNIGQAQMDIYSVTGSSWTNSAQFIMHGDILLQFRPVWA